MFIYVFYYTYTNDNYSYTNNLIVRIRTFDVCIRECGVCMCVFWSLCSFFRRLYEVCLREICCVSTIVPLRGIDVCIQTNNSSYTNNKFFVEAQHIRTSTKNCCVSIMCLYVKYCVPTMCLYVELIVRIRTILCSYTNNNSSYIR